MLDETFFTYQLPSEKALREGEAELSSTMLNALCEASATLDRGYHVEPVRERYVRELLERRRRDEASRAMQRKQRQTKWARIASGEEPAAWLTSGLRSIVSDPAGELPYNPAPRPAPVSSPSPDPFDALLGAVEDVTTQRLGGRPSAPPVIVSESGEELLSIREAASWLGIKPSAMAARVKRGRVRSVKRDVRRVPASEIQRIKFGAPKATTHEAKAA